MASLRRRGRLEAVGNFNPAALLEARLSCQLSQDRLGEMVGIPRPNVIAYEKGRRTPGAERLGQLARALRVDPLDLTTATSATATLTDLRMRADLSAAEMAERLGVSRGRLRAVESGDQELPSELVGPLCELLAVSEKELREAHRRSASGGGGPS
jgi:transcriptional regulator with XRE-family HTH domain